MNRKLRALFPIFLVLTFACVKDSPGVAGPPVVDTTVTLANGLPARVMGDRPDEVSGRSVHVVYVISSDGVDRRLDENLNLHWSIQTGLSWLAANTSGFTLRLDTYHGMADISFLRLNYTDAQLANADVRLMIQRALLSSGRLDSEKIYLAYYDGSHNKACGGASWPPRVPGQVAAMHLNGLDGRCVRPFVQSESQAPGYWEMAAVHDLLHVLGIVSPDAPNHTDEYPGHVPDPNDLMYTGTAPWQVGSLRVGISGVDYFGASVGQGIVDLSLSPFLARVTPNLAANLQAIVTASAEPVRGALPPHE